MKRFFYLLGLAGKSAWNRRGTLMLVVFSILISTALLLCIEKVRTQVKENFVQAVSGTDLIVGARGGEVELLLSAIFHLGVPQKSMRSDSFSAIAKRDDVAFCIPLSLGDSHEGYPVIATDSSLYASYQFRRGNHLVFAKGSQPQKSVDIVLGSDVAKTLAYDLGTNLVLSHGESSRSHATHAEQKTQVHTTTFTVSGILAPSGTPLDRSLLISLSAMHSLHTKHHPPHIHTNHQETTGAHSEHPSFSHGIHANTEHSIEQEQETRDDHRHGEITALLVGLKNRGAVFHVREELQNFPGEALSAVIPGVAMDSLWNMLGSMEIILFFISSLVTIAGLAGLAAVILAGLNERRRELAILRSVGARPRDIMLLLLSEGTMLVGGGIICGLVLLNLLLFLAAPGLADTYGILLDLTPPSFHEWCLMAGIFFAGVLTSLIPALHAYKLSLTDGLNVTR